jgi:hypothetical protein
LREHAGVEMTSDPVPGFAFGDLLERTAVRFDDPARRRVVLVTRDQKRCDA